MIRTISITRKRSVEQQLGDRFVEVFGGWRPEALIATCREHGVPAVLVNDTLTVWDHPQVEAREMHRTFEHPNVSFVDTLGFPVKYDAIEQRIDRYPPRLGEHTADVLREHGFSESDIEELHDAGVIDSEERSTDGSLDGE